MTNRTLGRKRDFREEQPLGVRHRFCPEFGDRPCLLRLACHPTSDEEQGSTQGKCLPRVPWELSAWSYQFMGTKVPAVPCTFSLALHGTPGNSTEGQVAGGKKQVSYRWVPNGTEKAERAPGVEDHWLLLPSWSSRRVVMENLGNLYEPTATQQQLSAREYCWREPRDLRIQKVPVTSTEKRKENSLFSLSCAYRPPCLQNAASPERLLMTRKGTLGSWVAPQATLA